MSEQLIAQIINARHRRVRPSSKQYTFSLRNPRRRRLHEVGECNPQAWGFFYPKALLHATLEAFS